jgi:hypothetical protein
MVDVSSRGEDGASILNSMILSSYRIQITRRFLLVTALSLDTAALALGGAGAVGGCSDAVVAPLPQQLGIVIRCESALM